MWYIKTEPLKLDLILMTKKHLISWLGRMNGFHQYLHKLVPMGLFGLRIGIVSSSNIIPRQKVGPMV